MAKTPDQGNAMQRSARSAKLKTLWYDRRILVLLLLKIFPPAGVYGLWRSRSFTPLHKKTIAGIITLALLVFFFYKISM